jgi:hypothetical protein
VERFKLTVHARASGDASSHAVAGDIKWGLNKIKDETSIQLQSCTKERRLPHAQQSGACCVHERTATLPFTRFMITLSLPPPSWL